MPKLKMSKATFDRLRRQYEAEIQTHWIPTVYCKNCKSHRYNDETQTFTCTKWRAKVEEYGFCYKAERITGGK